MAVIWRPGFAHLGMHRAAARLASLISACRRYRGTPGQPGLVLGLDRGGACHGVAFKVPGIHAADVLRYLDDRDCRTGRRSSILPPSCQLGCWRTAAGSCRR